MSGKSNNVEAEKRVNQLYEMLLSGFTRIEILQFASNIGWGVCDRTIDNYIHKAKGIFRKCAKTHQETEFGKALARLNRLYREADDKKDIYTRLAIQKEINTLLSLYKPARLDVTTDGEKLSGFKIEMIKNEKS